MTLNDFLKTELNLKKLLLACLYFLLTFQIAANAGAQSSLENRFAVLESASQYDEAINKARSIIDRIMARGAPGISVAVGIDGQIVWSEGFGYSDAESQIAVAPVTKFRMGSVSKTMTSIAMAALYEEGVIDLDVPIQTYLPEYPVKEKGAVSIRLLASHRAGIRHYLPDGSDNFIQKHYDNVVDALEVFRDDPLIAIPGERYSYSSHGWNLLSAVLQEASGVEFLTLMATRVFAPLNLTETVPDQVDYIIPNRARPYILRDGKLINAPFVDNSYKWAGGGYLATASDLAKFGYGVFNSGILKDETLDLLLAPPLLPDGSIADQEYGLGWRTFDEDRGWYGHTGGSVGGRTLFMYNPKAKVSVGVMCNMTDCFQLEDGLLELGNQFLP